MEVKDLSTLNDDLAIIQKLEDEPNDMGGMSAADLKAAFDRSGLIIQEYINKVLIPELKSESGAANLGMIDPDGQDKSNVQAVVAKLAKSLKDVVIAAGALPLGGTAGQLLRKAGDDNYDTEWGGVLESQLPAHLTRANQLSGETAALFGMDGNAVPNDVLRILSGALVETDGRVTHLDGTLAGVQVAVGTYEGTNTYGAANPNVLTFDFDPKVVFIRSTVGGFGLFVVSSLTSEFADSGYLSTHNDALGTGSSRNAKYENKTLTWYGTSNATYQLNGKYTFTYVAIG